MLKTLSVMLQLCIQKKIIPSFIRINTLLQSKTKINIMKRSKEKKNTKKSNLISHKLDFCFFFMVGDIGFEPTTPCL